MRSEKTYRRRPTEIKAMQWTGDNEAEIAEWTGRAPIDDYPGFKVFLDRGPMLYVQANRQWLPLDVGEWIAKDKLGFYPIKDSVFRSTYDLLEET